MSLKPLQDLRSAAAPQDVVAYLPSDSIQRAVCAYTQESTNFVVIAMTGLDRYFSSESYTALAAIPGLSGQTSEEITEKAEHVYRQRLGDVESFIKGDMTADASERLINDHVRWIVILGDDMQKISSSATPWRRTSEIAIYRLPP